MTTALEHRMNVLQGRLKARTRAGGQPKAGYEQSVAMIKAEMEEISQRVSAMEANDGE